MTSLNTLLPPFVPIPARSFRMGTPERDLSRLAKAYGGTRESYREESPQHAVSLPAFAIAQVPVTNKLYAAFVAASGAAAPLHWHASDPPAHLAEHPVVNVSLEDALAFCGWLSGAEGGTFRLPSEAEWEHAARGEDGRSFPWGDEWSVERANTRESGLASTTPVGSYPTGASPYGVLDMAGNVWEWTTTADALYPYRADDGREHHDTPGRRIVRGGCYANPHGYARTACRFRMPPTMTNDFLGFRLVRDSAR